MRAEGAAGPGLRLAVPAPAVPLPAGRHEPVQLRVGRGGRRLRFWRAEDDGHERLLVLHARRLGGLQLRERGADARQQPARRALLLQYAGHGRAAGRLQLRDGDRGQRGPGGERVPAGVRGAGAARSPGGEAGALCPEERPRAVRRLCGAAGSRLAEGSGGKAADGGASGGSEPGKAGCVGEVPRVLRSRESEQPRARCPGAAFWCLGGRRWLRGSGHKGPYEGSAGGYRSCATAAVRTET